MRCLFGGLAPTAALFLGPNEAPARDECGALVSGEAACPDDSSPYASGIRYDVADGCWVNGVADNVALTVTGGSQTMIASSTVTGWRSGGVIRMAIQGSNDSTTRTIALAVGSAGAVATMTKELNV